MPQDHTVPMEHAFPAPLSTLIAALAPTAQLRPAVTALAGTISTVMLAVLALPIAQSAQIAQPVPPACQEVTTLEVPVLHAQV